MKKRALALLCALALAGSSPNLLPVLPVQAAQTGGTTYYISSLHGDNAKAGTSENAAWETLDKLIGLELEPGDQVLLEKGSVFQDSYIHLQDVHGTAEAPIRIGSYGTGTAKPAIHANGQGIWYQQYGKNLDNANHRRQGYVSSAILLYDVDFVEVSDLELTNVSDDFDYFKGAVTSAAEASTASADTSQNKRMDRTGVAGLAKNGGTMEHVYLDNLYIHDVDGNIGDKHMDNGGIQMNVAQPDDEEETGIARYHDIHITNCYVRDVSRAGICVGYTYQCNRFNGADIADETAKKYGHTDVLFENNYVKDVGNDGIVAMYAYRPLVQNNVADRCGADMDAKNGGYSIYYGYVCAGIWPWKCKDGIFQYNEGFDTVNNQDGMPWDIDFSDGTIYQYNYSHNNGGGCIMFCGGEAYRGTFRYNISQNDLKGFLILSGNPKGEVYNNVFYVDGDLSTKIHNPGFHNGAGVMRNNIFYNVSSAAGDETGTGGENGAVDEPMTKTKDTWKNNIFYGYDDRFDLSDLNGDGNISADPKFVSPGHAPTSVLLNDGGMATIHERSAYDGYKLQADSPAINAGVSIKDMPENDFFGNEVGLQPDIGAFESDAAETGASLDVQTRAGTAMIIKKEKAQIWEVPREMTAGELKKALVHAKGSSLAIVTGEGGQAVNDSAVVDDTMKVRVTAGSETRDYAVVLVRDYWEYAPASMTPSAGSTNNPNHETEGGAALVLDNRLNTVWHSAYGGCSQNEVWVQFDLGEEKDVAMVKYVARPSGVNGIFEEYKVEVSNDNSTWTEVDRGIWSGAAGATEYSKFEQTQARYVRLSGLQTASDSTNTDGTKKIFGSAAEIRIGYEDDGVLKLQAKEGSGLTVADNTISDVPRLTTAQKLKEMLACSPGAVLDIRHADGSQASDKAVIRSGMQVMLARGSETRDYTLSLKTTEIEYAEYDRTSMTATAGSAETSQANSPASNVLDGNLSTIWHTDWNGCRQEDVWIQIDLKEVMPVAMVKYVAKQTGSGDGALNGIFEEYKVEVSQDGSAWTTAAEGSWSGTLASTEYAKFETKEARYVKLSGTKTKSGSTTIFGTAAEVCIGYEVGGLMLQVPEGSDLAVTADEIRNVPKQTTARELKEQLAYSDEAELEIMGADGQEAVLDSEVRTGMKARLIKGEEIKEYTISLLKEYQEYGRDSMTAEVGSSHSGNGADKLLDGNTGTIWHTDYTDAAGCRQDEVWIKIDLGEVKDVAMVKYVPRQSGGANGIFVNYKVQVSETGADGSWTDADSGTWSGELGKTEYAKFDTVRAQYVKLIGESTTTAEQGKIFGTAAEIRIGYEAPEE